MVLWSENRRALQWQDMYVNPSTYFGMNLLILDGLKAELAPGGMVFLRWLSFQLPTGLKNA